MRPILVAGGDLGAGRAPHCAGFRKWIPFRGRRQWPQASQSADPGGHGGVWVNGRSTNELYCLRGYRGPGAGSHKVYQSVTGMGSGIGLCDACAKTRNSTVS